MTTMSPMNFLRTLEQVVREDGEHPIYVVAALPKWAHYDPDECPAPIRAWDGQQYPDVVIEQPSGFDMGYGLGDDCDNSGVSISELTPVFRLGFNADQAAHFQQAWSNPPLDSPESPSRLYFLKFDRPEKLRIMGTVEHHAAVTGIRSQS